MYLGIPFLLPYTKLPFLLQSRSNFPLDGKIPRSEPIPPPNASCLSWLYPLPNQEHAFWKVTLCSLLHTIYAARVNWRLLLTLISLLYVSQQRQYQTFESITLQNDRDIKGPRNKGIRLSSSSNLTGADRQRADEHTDKHTGKQWSRAVKKWIPGVGCTWISLSAYPVKSPWNGKADEQGPRIEVRGKGECSLNP